ncbi:MAG TPA: hypothetical protein VFV98_09270 [Vicinamibacterales bacterium]|nr:hypothetical protein [Vicinamibacterales bacterium]
MAVILPAVVISLIAVLLVIHSVRARRDPDLDDATRITSRHTLARLDGLVRAGQDPEPQAVLRR